MTDTTAVAFKSWAILELMGHRVRIGFVEEVEIAGGKMLRIDIPTDGGDVTEFYGCASVYSLRPVAEDYARDQAKRYGDPRPVRPVEYKESLPAPAQRDFDDVPENF